MDAPAYKQRYPGLRVLTPKGSRERVEQVIRVDGVYEDFPHSEVLRLETLHGVADSEGALIVHSSGRHELGLERLHVQYGPEARSTRPSFLRPFSAPRRDRECPRLAKLVLIKDKQALRADFERYAELPNLVRVIVAHEKVASGADRAGFLAPGGQLFVAVPERERRSAGAHSNRAGLTSPRNAGSLRAPRDMKASHSLVGVALGLVLTACVSSPQRPQARPPRGQSRAPHSTRLPLPTCSCSRALCPMKCRHSNRITDAAYRPAFEAGMAEQRGQIAAIANDPAAPSFENTIVALERSGRILYRVSNVFFNLQGANTNPELDAIARGRRAEASRPSRRHLSGREAVRAREGAL